MATKFELMLKEMGIELDEPALRVLSMLQRKKEISEEDIAKKLKLKINETRKILYRLYEKRLATYVKRADPKKKWWYIYYWSLNKKRIEELFIQYKEKQIENKRKELEAEQRYAFECRNCKKKYTYTEALETEFTCPDCGSILEQTRVSAVAKKLEKEIDILENELNKLKAKLEKERAKLAEKAKEEIKKKPAKKKTRKKRPAKKKIKKKPAKRKPAKKKVAKKAKTKRRK